MLLGLRSALTLQIHSNEIYARESSLLHFFNFSINLRKPGIRWLAQGKVSRSQRHLREHERVAKQEHLKIHVRSLFSFLESSNLSRNMFRRASIFSSVILRVLGHTAEAFNCAVTRLERSNSDIAEREAMHE